MRNHCLLCILATALIAGWLLGACASPATPLMPPDASPTPTPAELPSGMCGDGVCDQAELENPALCPQDCQATPPPIDQPPTATAMLATPTVQPSEPAADAKCGDGVCDEMEQKDPQLCPQDCPAESAPAAGTLPASGSPDYEPPINVFLILHTDEIGELGMETFKPEESMYKRTFDKIDWLLEEAARHNLHFTALYNGWFTKWALDSGDLSQFAAVLAAGHEIGSEAHQITYDPVNDIWVKQHDELSIFGRPNYNPELARQCWQDSASRIDAILQAIGAGENAIMCSPALSLSDERNLMAEFGFSIAAGNRFEAGVNALGHMPWNPWRAANSDEPGYEIAEDQSSPYVSINHAAQIGGSLSHDVAATVPQLQRQFIQLYIEWLSRERTGAEDRVWSFGFVDHPNHGNTYNDALVQFLDWLDTYFIGKLSPNGNLIARYATVGAIADEFYAWEGEHPGVSSFHYVKDDPYPYTYAAFAELLRDADYVAHLELGVGISGFSLSKAGEDYYLLWSDQGEQTLDFSSQLSGQVLVTDAAGEQSTADSASLLLSEEPVMVQINNAKISP